MSSQPSHQSQVQQQFQKSIVIDLDHTICKPDNYSGNSVNKYRKARPIPSVIQKLKKLKEQGYYIIIHTARRMKTCENDVQKVKEAVSALTYRWLDEHEVPYDELIFGKPYATHYYVDDKAMTIEQFLSMKTESVEDLRTEFKELEGESYSDSKELYIKFLEKKVLKK